MQVIEEEVSVQRSSTFAKATADLEVSHETTDDGGQTPDLGIHPTPLRNIHFAPPSPETRNPTPDTSERGFRKQKLSPNEHFARKVAQHGKPLEFPKSVIALILQKQRMVEVTKNGLTFDYLKTSYTYWHPHSTTCANQVGLKVLATFDPDDMSFLHILTPDGRYVESIPQKNRINWFDSAALQEERRAKKASLALDIERFREVHGPTTEQKAKRVVSNAEKMQIVNTFPAEASPAEGSAKEGRFAKAEDIQAALTTLRAQKAKATDRAKAMLGFKPADLVGAPVSDSEGETEAWDVGTGSRARPRFKAEALL